MRQIALDTETTGLDPTIGHRIIEIACVEIIDRNVTGQSFRARVNPEREIEEKATQVHGYTWNMLKNNPLFGAVCDEFLEFVKGSEVLIHNASFDLGFLDAEFARLKRKTFIKESSCKIVDTLEIARAIYPEQSNKLDVLCDRYRIDRSRRIKHDALLDAQLLAQVYLAMTGGQTSMSFSDDTDTEVPEVEVIGTVEQLSDEGLVVVKATDEEINRHRGFLSDLDKLH